MRLTFQTAAVLATVCLLSLLANANGLSAQADCPQDYTQAMTLLDSAQKSALAGNHPSADAFSKNFETAVNKLSTGGCMPELVKLIEHIRAEQNKYGAKPDAAPAPVTD